MRRFLLIAFGSAGDVMPMLTLGQALRRRGHRVTVLTGGGFQEQVAAAGLENPALMAPEFGEQSHRDAFLLGTRYHALYFRRHAVAWNAALLRFIAAQRHEHPILVAAERPLIWADLHAHLHFGLPSVRLVVDPPPVPGLVEAAANSRQAPARSLSGGNWQCDWTRAARLAGFGAGFNHVARLIRASQRTVSRIALWPKWLVPENVQPPRITCLGFLGLPETSISVHFHRSAQARPLLVFIAGSAGTTAHWERPFAEISRGICRFLDCDGILLGGSRPEDWVDSRTFVWQKHLPLNTVLPAAAAIVHHGGIGTAAAALRHGVPQLIVPRVFSQPATAEWMRRLGVAEVLTPADFSVKTGIPRICEILYNPAYQKASRSYGERIDPGRDASKLCDFFQTLPSREMSSHPSRPLPAHAY